MDSILLIEDDTSLRTVSEYMLREAGYHVTACASGESGLKHYAAKKPDIVITDVQMPGLSGYEVLTRVRAMDKEALVIVVTAYGSIESAVEAMKLGAFDYISKPFSREQLIEVANKALKLKGLKNGNRLTTKPTLDGTKSVIVGHSESMRILFRMITRISASEATILILGESGTGKEMVARSIHHASVRTAGPFVPVNCAAIPRELLESELFGHVKGAYTGAINDRIGKFEQANGGTIFLDEIGDMPLELQPKLLRVLQEREIGLVGGQSKSIDVRVVAATNQNIEHAVAKGRFREDLYYRLAVIPVKIPPLRNRREDIRLLIEHFLEKSGRGSKTHISEKALASLYAYNWPGNVRELENIIEQMLVLHPACTITEKDLPPKIILNSELKSKGILKLPEQGFSLTQLEREAVLQALIMNNWNVSRAAEFLQVPRHVLAYRMEKHEIVHPE